MTKHTYREYDIARYKFLHMADNWDIDGLSIEQRWKSIERCCNKYDIPFKQNMTTEQAKDYVVSYFDKLMNDSNTSEQRLGI